MDKKSTEILPIKKPWTLSALLAMPSFNSSMHAMSEDTVEAYLLI